MISPPASLSHLSLGTDRGRSARRVAGGLLVTDSPVYRANRSRRLVPCPRAGFTLIELLVVITIIVVLMGLLFPAFRGVQDQGKKTQAKNDLTQIVTAVDAYYTEYGNYPIDDAAADLTFDGLNGNGNDRLFNGLRGQDTNTNPRGVVFITIPAVKDNNNPRSGISGANGQFYDPWGTPYLIRMDTTYDNVVAPNPYFRNAGFSANVNAGTIAWSFGKDLLSDSVPGPAPDKLAGRNDDDVISWQ